MRTHRADLSLTERLALNSTMLPNGCRVWTAKGRTSGGYGVITVDARTRTVHRVAWEVLHGEIPAGMSVCHSCDNRTCINPDHLWLGTPRDNTQDAIAKGHMWWQVAS